MQPTASSHLAVRTRGVTYDTGALIAAERGDRRMWSLHRGLLEDRVDPIVPAPVLAEVWRGGRAQQRLAQVLTPCLVEALDEPRARAVGAVLARSPHIGVVDAAVVEGAARRRDAVVTADRADIAGAAAALGVWLHIEDV